MTAPRRSLGAIKFAEVQKVAVPQAEVVYP